MEKFLGWRNAAARRWEIHASSYGKPFKPSSSQKFWRNRLVVRSLELYGDQYRKPAFDKLLRRLSSASLSVRSTAYANFLISSLHSPRSFSISRSNFVSFVPNVGPYEPSVGKYIIADRSEPATEIPFVSSAFVIERPLLS